MKTTCLTVHPFDPWGTKIGGIESVIRSILKYAPEKFNLKIVGVAEDASSYRLREWNHCQFEGHDINFYPLFTESRPNERRTIPLFLRFPLALRKSHLDFNDAVVIYHRIEPLAFANLPAKTTILVVHGDPREITGSRSEVKWKYLPWLYRKAEQRAVRRAQSIYCVHRQGLSYLENNYRSPDKTFSFLPTWYRPDLFFPGEPNEISVNRSNFAQRLGIKDPSPQFVLFAGRWERQKNPILAIDTFELASRENPNLHLLAAGTGGLKETMEQRVHELQLIERVHLLGSLEPTRLADVMRLCDVMLVTSGFEGMPVLVLEAHACGLPVVSTDSGETRAIVKDGQTGRIVTERTPETLAGALLETLKQVDPFTKHRCADAVKPYRPEFILPNFFENISYLNEQ